MKQNSFDEYLSLIKNPPAILSGRGKRIYSFLQVIRNGFQQRAGGVAAMLPVHEAQEAFFFDIGAFLRDGFRVVKGDEGAAVKEIGGFGGIVPIPDEVVFSDVIL